MVIDVNERVMAAAQLLYDGFENFKRPGSGDSNVALKDEHHGTWMQEAVHAAHEDALPDDWIYEQCQEMARRLADNYDGDEEIEGDIYTSDLYKWLAEVNGAEEYVDEAVRSFGWPEGGITAALGLGSMEHRRAIFYGLRTYIENNIDEIMPEEAMPSKCFSCGKEYPREAMFGDDYAGDLQDFYCLDCAIGILDEDREDFAEDVTAAIREAQTARDDEADRQAARDETPGITPGS